MVENKELLLITSTDNLDVSVEINTAMKRITFSQTASVDTYVKAINRLRYFNGENAPYPTTRFVDFLVNPGGGAPSDTAFTAITIYHDTVTTNISVNNQSLVCNPASVVASV